jgi:hypothetical protein
MLSLVTNIFFQVLLLNQRWHPPLRFQVSDCSTFRNMCVLSAAVFVSVAVGCFPGMASNFFLKPLVTIPVARHNTDIILYFRFHIHCISIHKPLYYNFFSSYFCTTFPSLGIATSISMQAFSCLLLIIIYGFFDVLLLWITHKSTAFYDAKAVGWARGFLFLTEFRRFLFVITNQRFCSPHNLPTNADRGISLKG